MRSKMYQVISISSNLSGFPCTQVPKASPGHTHDAARLKDIYLEGSKENVRAPNMKYIEKPKELIINA